MRERFKNTLCCCSLHTPDPRKSTEGPLIGHQGAVLLFWIISTGNGARIRISIYFKWETFIPPKKYFESVGKYPAVYAENPPVYENVFVVMSFFAGLITDIIDQSANCDVATDHRVCKKSKISTDP